MDRDLAAILSERPGFLTNLPMLDQIRVALIHIKGRYSNKFPKIIYIDTRNVNPMEPAKTVVNTIKDEYKGNVIQEVSNDK